MQPQIEKKWQGKHHSLDEILRQLKEEPKVVLTRLDQLSESTINPVPEDSVPDAAYFIECSATEEDTTSVISDNSINPDLNCDDVSIEMQLLEMFEDKNMPTAETVKTPEAQCNTKRRKRALNDLLIKIFGSTLSDLEDQPLRGDKKEMKKIKEPRCTLPVSINIESGDFVLKSDKIRKKRRSITDSLHPVAPKVPKTQSRNVAALEEVDYDVGMTQDLIIQPVIYQRAVITEAEENMSVAKILVKVELHTSVVESQPKMLSFIDLTMDDYVKTELNQSFDEEITKTVEPTKNDNIDIKNEPLSMPLLVPITAESSLKEHQPTQQKTSTAETQHVEENTIPKTCQPEPVVEKPPQPTNVEKTTQPLPCLPQYTNRGGPLAFLNFESLYQNAQPKQHNVDNQQNNVDVQLYQRPVEKQSELQHLLDKPTITQQGLSGGRMLQVQPTGNAPPPSQRLVASGQLPRFQIRYPQVNIDKMRSILSVGNRSNIQRTDLPSQGIDKPPLRVIPQQRIQPAPNLQHHQPPPPTNIYQLHMPSSYYLISNMDCGKRIFPHVYKFVYWRKATHQYFETTQNVLSTPVLTKENSTFTEFSGKITHAFGLNLINDLLAVDVNNFVVNQVLNVITQMMLEKGVSITMYAICMHISAMIKGCKASCVTPFTKKFSNNIEVCTRLIEERSQGVALMSEAQVNQLKIQIQHYFRIQKWIEANIWHIPSVQRAEPTRNTQKPERTIFDKNRNHVEPPPYSANLQTTNHVQDSEPRAFVIVRSTVNIPTQQEPVQVAKRPTPVQVQATKPPTPVQAQVSTPATPVQVESRHTTQVSSPSECEVIDLTWIEDGDANEMLEEVIESKIFPFKVESHENRENVSPTDSGLGSPVVQAEVENKSLICLCGLKAAYMCACNKTAYCGRECQSKDWIFHKIRCFIK